MQAPILALARFWTRCSRLLLCQSYYGGCNQLESCLHGDSKGEDLCLERDHSTIYWVGDLEFGVRTTNNSGVVETSR